MSHNSFELLEGAFLVTDAHYSPQNPQLLAFIKAINAKELQPTQLIFLGDTFDLLFGGIPSTQIRNQEIIDEIKKLTIDVVMFEGNHDFALAKLFPNFKVYSIGAQPISASYQSKKILFSHGDFDADWGYRLYSSIIRNPVVLKVLNIINLLGDDFIIKSLENKLSHKKNCNTMQDFYTYIEKRFEKKNYVCDYFIDGHYHQNKSYKINNFTYINLGAFACNQRYFSVKFIEDKELLEEFSF
jgi:UDP-2,3-diacylglucosamine hydrolase